MSLVLRPVSCQPTSSMPWFLCCVKRAGVKPGRHSSFERGIESTLAGPKGDNRFVNNCAAAILVPPRGLSSSKASVRQSQTDLLHEKDG